MPEAEQFLSSFSLPSKVRPIPAGTEFGDLVVIGPAEPFTRNNGRKAAASLCRCACGSERRYKNNGLRNGRWQSCGCKQQANSAAARIKHGHAQGGRRSPVLDIWKGMLRRCSDPKFSRWEDYGGRGITVCERWRADFLAFLADVGPRPSPSHTLERIDNNANYEPSNVRWATKNEQANNKRNNRQVDYLGETITLAELARRTGLPSSALRRRLVAGLNVDEAIAGTKARRRS